MSEYSHSAACPLCLPAMLMLMLLAAPPLLPPGCDKKKFLAALGVEEAKEKVKHRPDRAAPGKRKKISRAKKSALQQQKHAHDKNKIGVVIGHKHTTGGKKKTEGGTGAAAGKSD